jgi:hypothetical protein
MHVLSILFSGKQIGNRKYILQWREFSVWEQVPVTRLGTHITSSVYHVHFYLFDKRNVCALIHAGSCYKIEGQFILKKILTTMICTCKVRNEIQTQTLRFK